jgi:N-acetylmuramoyl-L-alanine amidase
MKHVTILCLIGVCAASVTAQAAGPQRTSSTIVLDAGHGGFDRGGVPGQRISEKDKTLDVALRLRQILRASGYRVVMTRDGDYFVPLPTRVAIANSYRDATFVSIHFNCAPRSGANGIETYYYRGDSANLAARIHRNVVAGAPSENRGIRRRGFYVIRKTAIPSVLVECGFLTNPTEGQLSLTAQYRQQLAQEIANGIIGGPTPAARPINPGSAISSEVLPQAFSGADFVRAAPHSAKAKSKHSKTKAVTKASKKKKKRKAEET